MSRGIVLVLLSLLAASATAGRLSGFPWPWVWPLPANVSWGGQTVGLSAAFALTTASHNPILLDAIKRYTILVDETQYVRLLRFLFDQDSPLL